MLITIIILCLKTIQLKKYKKNFLIKNKFSHCELRSTTEITE